MYLKFVYLCSVLTCIFAAPSLDEVPLKNQQYSVIPIISQSAEYEANGKFKYTYETGNGIIREETTYDKESPQGKPHSDGSNEGGEDEDSGEIHVQKGSYSYTAPDGTVVSVRYIADENGFQPIITEINHGEPQSSGNSATNVEKSKQYRITKTDQNSPGQAFKKSVPSYEDVKGPEEVKLSTRFGDLSTKNKKKVPEDQEKEPDKGQPQSDKINGIMNNSKPNNSHKHQEPTNNSDNGKKPPSLTETKSMIDLKVNNKTNTQPTTTIKPENKEDLKMKTPDTEEVSIMKGKPSDKKGNESTKAKVAPDVNKHNKPDANKDEFQDNSKSDDTKSTTESNITTTETTTEYIPTSTITNNNKDLVNPESVDTKSSTEISNTTLETTTEYPSTSTTTNNDEDNANPESNDTKSTTDGINTTIETTTEYLPTSTTINNDQGKVNPESHDKKSTAESNNTTMETTTPEYPFTSTTTKNDEDKANSDFDSTTPNNINTESTTEHTNTSNTTNNDEEEANFESEDSKHATENYDTNKEPTTTTTFSPKNLMETPENKNEENDNDRKPIKPNNTKNETYPISMKNNTSQKEKPSVVKDNTNETVLNPAEEIEKHEKKAEHAAETAVKAAEVAIDAANVAQKAAKETKKIADALNQPNNQSQQISIDEAKKHAKQAEKAAKEAKQAAEMAQTAADNAKTASDEAESVVKLVESAANTNSKAKNDKDVAKSSLNVENRT